MEYEHTKSSTLQEISEEIFFGYNASKKLSHSEGGEPKPLIQIGNVIDGHLTSVENCKTVEFKSTHTTDRYLLRTGDVLISARGTLMKCAVVGEEHQGAVASANFAVVRLISSEFLPLILWAHVNSDTVQSSMMQKASGTAQPSLSLKDFRNLRISIPDRTIQHTLAEMITAAESQYKHVTEVALLRREEAFDLTSRALGEK